MRRAHAVHHHFGDRDLAALALAARLIVNRLAQAGVLARIDLRFGRAGVGARARAAQHRLHHHGAGVGVLEQRAGAAGAHALRRAERGELDARVGLGGEQLLFEFSLESVGGGRPLGAFALFGRAMRDHGHRNRSGGETHDSRSTLAHGQGVPIDLNHHLGPNLTRKNSQSTPEQREMH